MKIKVELIGKGAKKFCVRDGTIAEAEVGGEKIGIRSRWLKKVWVDGRYKGGFLVEFNERDGRQWKELLP